MSLKKRIKIKIDTTKLDAVIAGWNLYKNETARQKYKTVLAKIKHGNVCRVKATRSKA